MVKLHTSYLQDPLCAQAVGNTDLEGIYLCIKGGGVPQLGFYFLYFLTGIKAYHQTPHS